MSLTPETTLDLLSALTVRVDQLERRLTTIEELIQADPAVKAITETVKDLARLQEAIEHSRDRVERAR